MAQEKRVNQYGDGVAWFRGSMLGKGAFGSVYLATLKNPKSKYSYYPSLMAVKSAEISASGSIQKEREVLSNIEGCPDIIRCFGEETTIGENGAMVYNLLLEYGSGGTLADRIKKLNGLPEIEVRLYARSILRGLNHIHGLGYVHCDLKPDNILLVPAKGVNSNFRAKTGDFGLAKREKPKQGKKRKLEPYWRGTPMYLSPEAVIDSVQEAPSDIWALGCIVLEMLTGNSPWERNKDLNYNEILRKIGSGGELPNVPNAVSKVARDFLKCCFVRKPMFRFTAEMLLRHTFFDGLSDDDEIEEIEEVEDLNEVEFSEEWSFASEEDLFPYSSEDEDEFDEEETLNVEGIERIKSSSISTELDQSNATEISSPKSRADFAPTFIIPARVQYSFLGKI